MLSNPYIAGNPVGGSNAFIGRADVLRSVLRVLKSPSDNAIVLYGQRRIGKTSVLQELAQRLPQEGAYQPVYFDLQDKAALPLAKVLDELAKRIAQQLGMDMPALDNNDLPQAFREVFIPAALEYLSFHTAQRTSLVVLFDEFDVLDNPGENQAGAAFFPYLRDLLTFNRRLQFVFVIGRRPEDLSSLTLSVFKGVKSERVSLLSPEDTSSLVRLAEANQSLHWTDAAVNHVYELSGGHPFLTQQLCQEIWEAAYQDDPVEPPTIESVAIDTAVAATLRSATNALEWLWNGLKPAQRIVASALAEAGARAIPQEELENRLQQSGVRILVGELQDAPGVLQEWDLIEPVHDGYRFRVELLRHWIVAGKSLARVQKEIDFIQPAAENLFQAAYALYQDGQLEQALPLLRQAVGLNPNHARGTLLLSEILLAQNQVAEAHQLLEALYQFQPAMARPRLVQALFALVIANSEEQQLPLLERILTLDQHQSEARVRRQQIWLQQLAAHEQAERYTEALSVAQQLSDEMPMDHAQRPDILRLQRKTELLKLYQHSLDALKDNNRSLAMQLLKQVIATEPMYREATRYLHLAVTGVDVATLQVELEQERSDRVELERALQLAQSKLRNVEAASPQLPLRPEEIPDQDLTSIKHPVWGSLPPPKPTIGTNWQDTQFDLTFVYVPTGEFTMGAEDGHANEKPIRQVILDAFWIMQTPVTNAQYRKGVIARVCTPPTNDLWEEPQFAQHPVTNINWEQASVYATWVGGRLPTEAEWEKAARGSDQRVYPWGKKAPDASFCNFGDNEGGTTPVSKYPKGVSPYGVLDMVGNVWEWVSDWYAAYDDISKPNPQGPVKGNSRVVRGGSWLINEAFVRASHRGSRSPIFLDSSLGFRVVRVPSSNI